MDIDKVRALSDAELETGPSRGEAGPVGRAVRALDPTTEGLQHDPADAANDRADPDRPARAQARPRRREGDHAMTGANTQVQGKRKTKVGRVVSDKMDKTIVVSVERLARHRLYKRVIRLTPSSRPTTRRTTPTSATPSSSRSRGRCRRRSAGGWSRSSPVPASTASPARRRVRGGRDDRGDPRAAHPGRTRGRGRRRRRDAGGRRADADACRGRRAEEAAS